MSRKRMIQIDGDKLMSALGRKALDPRNVSEDLGHDRGYMQDCYRLGRIGRPEATTLEKVYGIPVTAYEWIEGEQKELLLADSSSPERSVDEKTILAELYQTIKAAVKDALGEMEEEHGMESDR